MCCSQCEDNWCILLFVKNATHLSPKMDDSSGKRLVDEKRKTPVNMCPRSPSVRKMTWILPKFSLQGIYIFLNEISQPQPTLISSLIQNICCSCPTFSLYRENETRPRRTPIIRYYISRLQLPSQYLFPGGFLLYTDKSKTFVQFPCWLSPIRGKRLI